MAHLIQVGAGSGGMPVLDMLARDPRINRVTLIEPDVYKPHNVERHLFASAAVGEGKADLAKGWLQERRPDLEVRLLPVDLLDPAAQADIEAAVATADIGVCAADNEPAKYHWDVLMRRYRKPWTLGEVLSGGIGGFVHWFVPDGPCYGCVASHLKRSVTVEKPTVPDYSNPGGPVAETTIPAGIASIHAIAAMHALVTLGLLADPGYSPGFTSLLWTLQRVPDVFDEAFRPYRFRIPRSADCLICRSDAVPSSPEDLDVALDQRRRDWAMHDLWPMHRIGPRPHLLHFSYEKAGLTVHEQPIPWNAESVVVEGLLRLPPGRRRADFQLRLPHLPPIQAEILRRDENDDRHRLFFRLPPPPQTVTAEVFWRNSSLGELTLPVLSREDFVQQFRVQMPTLFVRLGEQNVACQTFVATQCKGLLCSAVLVSPTSLAPLLDLNLHVELRSERTGATHDVPVQLSSTQLQARQALVNVVLRRFPRRIGTWTANWMLGDRPLVTQRIRAISVRQFHRSLWLSDGRFVIQSDKETALRRQVPALHDGDRVGPCFLINSHEPGMAGLCNLLVRGLTTADKQQPLSLEQEVLISDGPTVFAPGTIKANEVNQVSGFELRLGKRQLGLLSMCPAPAANFTSEGSFRAPDEFIWSAAAEEELSERLTRLLEGPNTAEPRP